MGGGVRCVEGPGPEQYQERESAPVITFIGDGLGSGSPVPALPSAGSPAGGDETDGDAADDEFSDDEPLTEDEALVESSRDLRAEATSLSHLLTHMPKNPYCPSRVRATMTARPCSCPFYTPDAADQLPRVLLVSWTFVTTPITYTTR